MPRQLKTNGIYAIICALTGEPAGTTPAVFAARADRYGVSIDVLKDNYVGRTGAHLLRKMVNENGKTPSDAVNEIRQAFHVNRDSEIDDAVLDKIVGKVSAKARKAATAAEFAKKKADALAKLQLVDNE